jgi:colanic acid biosynthesis glycosyl transferase WcaI
MHILVVSQYFWPEVFRINDLVEGLIERGHQVTVLTGLPNYPDGHVFKEYTANPSHYQTYHGARIIRVPMLPRGKGSLRLVLNYLSFMIMASLWGPWALKGTKIDAIFTFAPSPIFVALPAIIMKWIKKAPMALWVLDLWPETLKAVGVVKNDRLLEAVGLIVSWFYRHSTSILAQSNSFIPKITQRCGEPDKIIYFPNWADQQDWQDAAIPAPEIPYEDNVLTILFTGNIGEAQNFPAVLKAALLLKDKPVRWVFVGDGRMAPWVREQIKKDGLENRILMPGRFPLERMPSFMARADALLVSLKADPVFAMTIPGKVQAYLSSGKPILAMLDGEGAELITRHNAGLSSPADDPKGLAENVLTLLQMSDAEKKAMGDNALRMSHTLFDRGKRLDQIVALFHKACSGESVHG